MGPNERARLLDQVTRRVTSLDDRALIALDRLTRDVARGASEVPPRPPQAGALTPPLPPGLSSTQPLSGTQPTNHTAPPASRGIGRRGFLLGLLSGGAMTVCAGSGVALLLTDQAVRDWLTAQGVLPAPKTNATPYPTLNPTLPADIIEQIRLLRADIDALTRERDALRVRVAELEQTLSAVASERDTLRRQVDALTQDNARLTAEKDQLVADNTRLQGLVALYQNLDATDLDGTISTGFQELTPVVTGLDPTALDQGATDVANVLATVEAQIPVIDAGLGWLDRESAALQANFRAFQSSLSLPSGADMTAASAKFANDMADALPITVDPASRVALQAMGAIVARLPDFLNNVSRLVLVPARQWVAPGGQQGLAASLIAPTRDRLVTPVRQTVGGVQNIKLIYNNKLLSPAQKTLQLRSVIRAEISQKSGVN